MNWQARRSLWLALVASLLLHLLALQSSGWGLPETDTTAAGLLDARLVPLPAKPAPPPAKPAPQPSLKPSPPTPPQPTAQPAPRPRPSASAAEAVAVSDTALPSSPSAPALPAPAWSAPVPPEPAPAEPAPAAPAPAAVPPASTFFAADAWQRWPRQGRLVFDVFRGESDNGSSPMLVGQSVHEWQHDMTTYALTVTTETVGLAALFRPVQVVQISRGNMTTTGLQPISYESLRDGKRKESVHFDRTQERIFFGSDHSGSLLPGGLDLVALFYQLGAWRTDYDAIQIQIATGRKAAEYDIVLLGTENLVVPLNEYRTRHFRITVAGSGDNADATELWTDIATGLPVKIRHRDRKGEVFDQLARQLDVKQEEKEESP